MTNKIFRDQYISAVKNVLEKAKLVEALKHHGLSGRAREIFVTDLVNPSLPSYVGTGSGKLTDHIGNLSYETDVVLYGKNLLAPLLFELGFGLYPAEACFYSIEVKTEVTSSQFSDVIKKSRALRTLNYLDQSVKTDNNIGFSGTPRAIPALFSFDSDLSGGKKTELDRYRDLDEQADTDPAVHVFCIVGKGYWYFVKEEACWFFHEPSDEKDEVIDFVGGIVNTIPRMAALKGAHPYGRYVIKERGKKKL